MSAAFHLKVALPQQVFFGNRDEYGKITQPKTETIPVIPIFKEENMDTPHNDYSKLDQPRILHVLFHPRQENALFQHNMQGENLDIHVDTNAMIGARFFVKKKDAPNILFFHGNGEIVSDYNDLGQMYNQMDINFLVVDYRGYGRSTGTPTITHMMRDCHRIFQFTKELLNTKNHTGPLIVMGRSLGSISALEIANHYQEETSGLIIESGIADASFLFRLFGMDPDELGYEEKTGFNNPGKMAQYRKPVLVIHAQQDHIIPFSDGATLFAVCPSREKEFLPISGANHNNILMVGLNAYMEAVRNFVEKC